MPSLYSVTDDGKVILTPHSGQAKTWLSLARYVFMIAGTQGGKCLDPQSLIYLADGSRKPVKDIIPGDVVLSIQGQRIIPNEVTASFSTGIKPAYKVTLDTGHELILTAEHPLLTSSGWVPFGELSEGSWVGIARTLPSGKKTLPKWQVRLMGYLMGDGGTTPGQLTFASVDQEVLAELEFILPEGYSLKPIPGDECAYRIVGYESDAKGHRQSIVRQLIREWEAECKAIDKRIPEFLFECDLATKAEFLGSLFACDGCITEKGIVYGTASEQLAFDIQTILSAFGIVSRKVTKHPTCNGKVFTSWEVNICDYEALATFDQWIYIPVKSEKLKALLLAKQDLRANGKDIIADVNPESIFKYIGTQHPAYGAIKAGRNRGNYLSRGTLHQCLDVAPGLLSYVTSDIFWAKIKSIEVLPAQEMWDITVDVGHNFIANGIFAHNTSFGPWWLWRETQLRGPGDYIAATASYDLFKLKMLPEMRTVFEDVLGIGRYWSGDKILELRDPETGEFWADKADDKMWGRIILRSAAAEGGLESATAKAAWLDEVGQDEFRVSAWEAVERRVSLNRGRVLGTTTPYNLGWLKQLIFDRWQRGDSDIDVIQFASTENPLFAPEELEAARKRLPDWKFRMFYLGQFDRPAGLIYGDFIDKPKAMGGHLVDRFDLPTEWPRIVGVDPGAVNLGLIWLAHDTMNDIWYAYREKHGEKLPTSEHARKALEMAKAGKERVIRWYVGAKGEVQQRLDWMAGGCSPALEPPIADVESGIDRVISLFRQHRLYVFSDMVGLIDELGSYARVLGPDGEPTEAIKDKSTYHHLDALRYACAGAEKIGIGFA